MGDPRSRAIAAAAVIGLVSVVFFLFSGPSSEMRAYARTGLLLDMTLNYSPTYVRDEFASYGEAGRALYGEFLVRDCIFAAIYTLVATTLIVLGLRQDGPRAHWLAAIPIALGGIDWVEDAIFARNLALFPAIDGGLIQIASQLTVIKWGLAAATILLVVVALAAYGSFLARTSEDERG